MSAIKERIYGAITVMSENDAEEIWNLISQRFTKTSWDEIEEVEPDEFDLKMLKDIAEDKDCQEFINAKDINWN